MNHQVSTDDVHQTSNGLFPTSRVRRKAPKAEDEVPSCATLRGEGDKPEVPATRDERWGDFSNQKADLSSKNSDLIQHQKWGFFCNKICTFYHTSMILRIFSWQQGGLKATKKA